MGLLFDSFEEWGNYCQTEQAVLWKPVLEYEMQQRNRSEEEIWKGIEYAYTVMCQAIETGLTKDMHSLSGMINNGAKRVKECRTNVLNEDFRKLIYRTLAAKEVNSCMGRIVAAPTAGASGILPGILYHLQDIHRLPNAKIFEGLLVAAGVALIIEKRASIAGAVGGCQAETGTAAAMGAAAIVYCLEGTWQQAFNAVAITIMNMLGLICDPIAGLVEVPCVKRNASGAAIAYVAAQMAIADYDPIIPVDEVIDVMGEVGESMDRKYKETALGGLAATPTGQSIAARVLQTSAEQIPDEEED
jgi:L-serine dehydratase